ncbi:MAG: ATP-binding protein [Muribaculaceae bacterium]|nr:ATP-binding protein [Muribaculaceae bacterium]
MIQDFSVENFLSFDSRQEISFEASSDKTSEESLIVKVKHPKTNLETRLLRMSVIYGANASGKTNLLYAIADVWDKLYTPHFSKDEKIVYRPFAIRDGENTKMELSFFIDGVKYTYKIEYNSSEIVCELLEFNPNGVLSMFYERRHNYTTNLPEIIFGKNVSLDSKTSQAIVTNTLPNHSVLSAYNKISVDAPAFEKVVKYIRQSIFVPQKKQNIINLLRETLSQPDRKSFLLQAVKEADFNICDIVSRQIEKDTKIEFTHSYSKGYFIMPIESESSGTLSFVEKMDMLYEVINEGRFMIIDELDDSLHYDLLVFFLQTFLSNDSSAQMLFTVHDQLILSEDFMRRDMVWFTEKDKESSSTELFSADDFNLHKNASIFNAYKLGKFGARPSVGSPFLTVKSKLL